MDKNIKIAIIDNGINQFYMGKKIKSITITDNGLCVIDDKSANYQRFNHGTLCAMILEKYCQDSQFISIRILDEKGRGEIKNLYPALEWCYKNQIKLINMSLGSLDYRDCEKLRSLVNEYATKGMIIIAAAANSGFMSYPACFTNVIGVATTGSSLDYSKDYLQIGIDTVVPSEHIVRMDDEEIKTSPSNSNATPYVSALIANKMMADNKLDIKRIKKYVKEQSHIDMVDGVYEPDWIFKAYIVGKERTSRAKYYFETVSGEINEIWNEADTVIAFFLTDLINLDIKNKNLIYLGVEDIHIADLKGFYWDRNIRQLQILNNHYKGKGLEIPTIILSVETSIDSFYILTELKRAFANGGYNAYAVGMDPECVLYALEYMPEPVSEYSSWKNFIASQVFYKQNDLVIWCIPLEDREKYMTVFPDCDVEISICCENDDILAELSFESERVVKKIQDRINRTDIEELYHIIEEKMTEDEDEQ